MGMVLQNSFLFDSRALPQIPDSFDKRAITFVSTYRRLRDKTLTPIIAPISDC